MVGSLGLGASGSVIICDTQQAVQSIHACMDVNWRQIEQTSAIYIYQRVEVVAAAGDADERRRGGGGRLEEAAVADVLGAIIGDGHGDGRHEQVHHLADHPPHH